MFFAIVFGWKDLLYVLGHAGVRLGLALSGIRFRVAGSEHIPHDRAAVYCSNHQSNVDPPIVFKALHRRMHILYKAELDRIPLLARAFRLGGFIPINRGNREASMRSIEAGADSIRSGNSFLIFPEGTRSKTGDLLPFKKGGFLMAIQRSGAHRAGGGAGRAGRDEEGQLDHPSRDRQPASRTGNRDEGTYPGRPDRADRASSSRDHDPACSRSCGVAD